MNQKVLKTHLEAELLFSICQFIVQLGAVDGVDDSSDQVNAGAEVVIAPIPRRISPTATFLQSHNSVRNFHNLPKEGN